MRLKKGSKVEVMNNEVRASRRVKKVSRGNIRLYQVEDDCLPVYNDARLKKRKRASSFWKDGSQSQRRSYEKVIMTRNLKNQPNNVMLHSMTFNGDLASFIQIQFTLLEVSNNY